ncbi:ACT domain-containing protein [Olsenella profusa]|uniref:ACT domain-containing protein n=1 Tax=Olsenella profusa TaxID=138595 RepID=A0ABS2F2G3_9ACTN|nr:ACT domain-containing protein [Olsenella profusa]
MELEVIDCPLSVCKVADYAGVRLEEPFTFTGRTDAERSLVCPTGSVPAGTLAEARVGIFAVSTFDTDYVLVKERDLERATCVLMGAGYVVLR